MQPGEIFILPRDDYQRGDPKSRAHVALSLEAPSTDLVTLAFCSTEETEAALGAPHVVLSPRAPTFGVTGLSELTYVYPSRLVTEEYARIGDPIGRVLDEMPMLRNVLRHALGLGTGTAITGQATGTLRGQVLLLGPSLAQELGTRHALVVANPRYSRSRRFLNIVPLYAYEDYEPAASDFVFPRSDWTSRVVRSGNVLCSVTAICSLFMPDPELFESLLGIALSAEEMAHTDRALESRFFEPENPW